MNFQSLKLFVFIAMSIELTESVFSAEDPFSQNTFKSQEIPGLDLIQYLQNPEPPLPTISSNQSNNETTPLISKFPMELGNVTGSPLRDTEFSFKSTKAHKRCRFCFRHKK